jgi:hypothetical protein
MYLTLRERALEGLGMEVDYDYHTGRELIRRTADKLRDPPPEPPWVFFPGQPVDWSGWRQGGGHAWLLRVWLPFWRGLSPEERAAYLTRWPPPDDDWRAGVKLP